jgi:hypothetical protein
VSDQPQVTARSRDATGGLLRNAAWVAATAAGIAAGSHVSLLVGVLVLAVLYAAIYWLLER